MLFGYQTKTVRYYGIIKCQSIKLDRNVASNYLDFYNSDGTIINKYVNIPNKISEFMSNRWGNSYDNEEKHKK